MQVEVVSYNFGTNSFYYSLVNANTKEPLHYCPNWKTSKGASKWALSHGYEVVQTMKCKAVVSIGEGVKADIYFTYFSTGAHKNLSMADVALNYIDTAKFPYARVEYVTIEE